MYDSIGMSIQKPNEQEDDTIKVNPRQIVYL